MYCIGSIKQLKYGYFGIQAVYITPRPWGAASGNKPGLGAMETAYIPHNHTLTVYYHILQAFIIIPHRKLNSIDNMHQLHLYKVYLTHPRWYTKIILSPKCHILNDLNIYFINHQ